MAFLIFLVIVILIAVPSIVKKKKKDKEEKAARESFVHEEMSSAADAGAMPTPVKSERKKAPANPVADNHKIYTVLRYRPEPNKWVCRNCESENAMALDRCSVCHQTR